MRKHKHEQGFIGLVLLIAVVLVAVGVVAFVALHKPSGNSNMQSSNANQQSLITLTGTVKQGPSEPVCDSSRPDCYQPLPSHTIQAVGSAGKVVGTTKTEGDGKYSMHLKPGHYVLELVPQADVYHIMNNEIDLSASNHQLDIMLDTGIR